MNGSFRALCAIRAVTVRRLSGDADRQAIVLAVVLDAL
jgi:hypothetical protein